MKNKTLKIISIIICLAIIMGSVPVLSVAENTDELKFTVATDTHYHSFDDAGEIDSTTINDAYNEGMLEGNLFYHATFQGQMNHESNAIIRKMLDEFADSDSEYLILPGDVTCGKRKSHHEFAELLRQTEQKSGKKIFVTCGNHDCDDDNFDRYIGIDEFKEIYAQFGFDEAISKDNYSASYIVQLNDEYRLAAIDSCIYGENDGKISDETLEWILEQAENAKKDGSKIIAMMHHSLLPHFSVQPMIDNYSNISEALADAGIQFVFTGHIHANDISSAKTKNGNIIYDIQTGSLIASPNAYRTVTVNKQELKIESNYITEIDTKYLPDGYTEEQLKAIKNDFPAYAYRYFESGVCRWLNKYIGSAGKVGKMLKLDPQSAEYKLIDSLMSNIGEALNLPIYDDGSTPEVIDSIEEIAGSAGVAIPESNYERMYQVAAVVMNGFYHGDEPDSIREKDFPILYSCLKAVLIRSIVNLTFSTNTAKLLNKLVYEKYGINPYNNMLIEAARISYASEVADRILQSLIFTLGDGFVTDLSEPSDINITIKLTENENPLNKTVELSIFRKILSFLKQFVSYLFTL